MCYFVLFTRGLEDTFEVCVKNEVNELLKLCKNVVVVCSKSGKLTSYLYKQCLKTVLNLT